MHPPIAVMFDWCNTIVRHRGLDYSVLSKVLKTMGYQDVDLGKVSASSLQSALKYLLGCAWDDALRLYEEYAGYSLNERVMQTNDNARELLEFLVQQNILMGIVSNENGDVLRTEVEELGLSKYFSAVLGRGDTPENKPSPVPLITALAMMNVQPSERVFFIGDSISDIESAKRANCLPVAYDNTGIKGVLSFTNFKDFGSFIENLLR